MGRTQRLEEPSGLYHVTSRGNNKSAIFVDEGDRLLFLDLLGRTSDRYRWLVFAHCLMTTHYHLVLQIPHGGLAAGMCLLNGDFARKANRRHGRGGHVFHDRYGAAPIARDGHLLEACRYVVLNPVRARVCGSPEAWRWSSYRACAGLEFAPRFLAESEFLGLFGTNPAAARRLYRAFVREGREPVPGTGS